MRDAERRNGAPGTGMRWLLPGLLALLAACAGPVSRIGPWRCEEPAGWTVSDDDIAAAFPDADTLRVETVAPGVRHAYVWQAGGPWAIHVLAVDFDVCGLGLDVRHAGPPLERAAGTRALARDALAGVNADFFALPEGTPVGPQVDDGDVQVGPGRDWPVFALTEAGAAVGDAEVHGWLRGRDDDGTVPYSLAWVNRPLPDTGYRATDGLAFFDAWIGAATPADSTARVLAVRRVDGAARSGLSGEELGVVVLVDSVGGRVPVGADTVAFAGRGRARDYLRGFAVNDTVRWALALTIRDRGTRLAAQEAVGGYPVLLRDGAVPAELATEPREAFGRQRHPRTAVGFAGGGRTFWLVTVDGRQAPYSDGMTLAELVGLMQRLGADEALNLDGGGSTTMVVEGRIVNRPSDPEGERRVGNALVVIAR